MNSHNSLLLKAKDSVIRILSPYISIIRLANVLMTGFAVFLGIWLSGTFSTPQNLLLLMTAAMCAAAFGNTINDLLDIKTDRISHPERPLIKGTLSVKAAILFSLILIASSLLSSFLVSAFHWKATLLPILLLSVYSFYFKRTPVIGNLLVASLVAYALLFGALPQPQYKILLIPALLAFLLNFCREIAKDIQDQSGDSAAGFTTTAVLPPAVLRLTLLGIGATYLSLLFLPSLYFKHYGNVYTAACIFLVLPLHGFWTVLVAKKDFRSSAGRIASVLKLEMLAGLLALSADKIVK